MFYSNCFFEAIRHKLKDWRHVKITYIPPQYNECFCPHFLWSDGQDDYDFGVERYLKWWERFWFKVRFVNGNSVGTRSGNNTESPKRWGT